MKRWPILVVSDFVTVRCDFSMILEDAGLEVVDAADAFAVTQVLHARSDVAAIAIDFSMRWTDARRLRMQLFRSARWRDLPVIALVADRDDAIGLACDVVLVRPLAADAAVARLVELLRPQLVAAPA